MADPVRIFRIPGPPAAGSNLPKLQTFGFFDSFARTDSATSLGVTTRGSKVWTPLRGTWGREGGSAYVSTAAAPGLQLVVADGLTPNGTVTLTMGAISGDLGAGLILRVQDANNHLLINSSGGNGLLRLWKRVGGSASEVATATSGGALVAGDVLTAEMSGTTIIIRRNGTVMITAAGVTQFASQTRHGMAQSEAATTRFAEISHTV